jgi:hypothetical protein
MNQDEQYLKLLSIFHYVVGGLTALFACFPLLHIAMGIAMLCGAFDAEDGPPKIFAWLFIIFPAVLMLCGWALSVCIIIAGRKLARRKARLYCLVIAALECILMPFGTVLGVFTIVLLMKDSVKQLFSANQPTQPTS